ncbi:porin, GBP family [Burkholderia sp. GAS332]|nr:porin, GBP family [Burkholderia sp. GAS332]
MKRTLLAAIVGSTFATVAHAQSAVTLYGLIDTGITYTNNQGGKSNVKETSANTLGSRWGLRGAEALGDDLKAIFTLETGYNLTNGALGTNGRMFGRQAYVGLASGRFGSVTLGRQYDSVVDYLGPMSLTGTALGGTYFAHPYDNDNLDNALRINNAVKYASNVIGGLKFGALYGFSNSPSFANNRAYSFGTSYNYGGLNVAAGYLQFNNDINALALGATAPGAQTGSYTFAVGIQRTFGAGASYALGSTTVAFVYTQTNLQSTLGGGVSPTQSGTTQGLAFRADSARFQNFEGNVRYVLTPEITLAGSYTYTRANFGGGVNPNFNQVNIYTDYLMSKRTGLYLISEYQHVSSNPLITAYLNGLSSASATRSQVAVSAGIRHRF